MLCLYFSPFRSKLCLDIPGRPSWPVVLRFHPINIELQWSVSATDLRFAVSWGWWLALVMRLQSTTHCVAVLWGKASTLGALVSSCERGCVYRGWHGVLFRVCECCARPRWIRFCVGVSLVSTPSCALVSCISAYLHLPGSLFECG